MKKLFIVFALLLGVIITPSLAYYSQTVTKPVSVGVRTYQIISPSSEFMTAVLNPGESKTFGFFITSSNYSDSYSLEVKVSNLNGLSAVLKKDGNQYTGTYGSDGKLTFMLTNEFAKNMSTVNLYNLVFTNQTSSSISASSLLIQTNGVRYSVNENDFGYISNGNNNFGWIKFVTSWWGDYYGKIENSYGETLSNNIILDKDSNGNVYVVSYDSQNIADPKLYGLVVYVPNTINYNNINIIGEDPSVPIDVSFNRIYADSINIISSGSVTFYSVEVEGPVNISAGKNVVVNGGNNSSIQGELNVSTNGGNIEATGLEVGGDMSLNASGTINFTDTDVDGNVELANAAYMMASGVNATGDVVVNDSGSLSITNIVTGGSFSVASAGSIVVSGIVATDVKVETSTSQNQEAISISDLYNYDSNNNRIPLESIIIDAGKNNLVLNLYAAKQAHIDMSKHNGATQLTLSINVFNNRLDLTNIKNKTMTNIVSVNYVNGELNPDIFHINGNSNTSLTMTLVG